MTKECGTCDLWLFVGHTGDCLWKPKDEEVPAAFNLSNMWTTDGKNCKTWVEKSS